MSKPTTYKNNDENPMSVAEPVMSYGVSSSTTDEFVSSIPFDAMHRMIDFAVTECWSGKGTPHEQVENWLEERLGWK